MGSMKAATARRPQKRGVQKPARKESLAKSAVAYAVADLPYHYDDVPGFFEPEPLAPAMSAEDAALALVNLSGSLSGPICLREPEPQPTLVTRQSAPPILELCGPSGRAQDHADAADDPSQVWYIAASQRGAAKAPGFAAPSEDRSGGPSRSVDRRGSERSAQTGMAPQYKLATSASSAQRPTGPEAGSEASCRPAHTPEPYVQLRTSTPPAPAPTPFHVVATTLPAVTDGVARGGAAPDCLAVLQGLLRAVLPATQQHAAAQHQVQRPSPPRCANGWEEAARSGVPLRAIPLSPALLRAQDPMLELLQRQRAAEFERRCWA